MPTTHTAMHACPALLCLMLLSPTNPMFKFKIQKCLENHRHHTHSIGRRFCLHVHAGSQRSMTGRNSAGKPTGGPGVFPGVKFYLVPDSFLLQWSELLDLVQDWDRLDWHEGTTSRKTCTCHAMAHVGDKNRPVL